FPVIQAMWVLGFRLQGHQVNYVDDADLQLRQRLSQQIDGSERLQRWNVAGAGHDDVGFAFIAPAACPRPDPDTGRAMGGGLRHGQPLWRWLLASHNDVDAIVGPQTM